MTAKDDLLTFKCVHCNKPYENKFDENLSKRFEDIYQFCDGDIKKFCLMLLKGVYACKYMDG